MITKSDLQEAIAECQGERNPNANTCLKLASYYIIDDHLFNEAKAMSSYSYANSYESDTEFISTIKNKDMNEVLPVLDELMTTLNVINPRLYEGVMAKLLY